VATLSELAANPAAKGLRWPQRIAAVVDSAASKGADAANAASPGRWRRLGAAAAGGGASGGGASLKEEECMFNRSW
jgi:hypothetical protein